MEKNVNGAISKFLYDGDQILAEYDASGVLVRKYVYGTGIDEPVCVIRGPATIIGGDEAISFYQFDGLGSITSLTDSSGQTLETYSYEDYGRSTIKDASGNTLTASAYGNRFMFTGREYDSESGLYHYRARAYDPKIGRFLQTDPLGYYDSTNLYAYVNNNPLRYIDPFGLCKVNSWAQISQVIETIVGMLYEPADWAFTIRDWASGDFSWFDFAGFIPMISHGTIKNIRNLNKNIRTYRHYGYSKDANKFSTGLRKGSFATTAKGRPLKATTAHQKLGLTHHSKPPDSYYKIRIDANKTPVKGPHDVPNVKQPGDQFIFPEGTPPGSVTGPFDID